MRNKKQVIRVQIITVTDAKVFKHIKREDYKKSLN